MTPNLNPMRYAREEAAQTIQKLARSMKKLKIKEPVLNPMVFARKEAAKTIQKFMRNSKHFNYRVRLIEFLKELEEYKAARK